MSWLNRFNLGLMVVFLVLVIAQPVAFHLNGLTVIDDGYYYLGYARNIALGNGATFDGLVITNGVQPLWAGLLVLMALVIRDPLSLMYAMMVVSLLLGVVSIFAMNVVLAHFFPGWLKEIVLSLYIMFVANPQLLLTGMETAVNLAVFTLTLAAVLRIREVNTRQILVAGILIGLVCLARVDNLIVTPIFALLLVWRTGLSRQSLITWVKPIITLALPAAIIFGLYLVYNFTTFERLLPISGDIKATLVANRLQPQGGRLTANYLLTTFKDTFVQYSVIVNYFFWMLLAMFSSITLFFRVIILLVLLVFVVANARNFRSQRPNIAPLLVCGSAAIIFAHTYLLFFQLGGNAAGGLNWYYVPEYVFLTIGIGFLVWGGAKIAQDNPRLNTGIRLLTQGLFIASLGIFTLFFTTPPSVRPHIALYQTAEWMNENLPITDIGAGFNSGAVGYYTEMSIINLDGLMNNQEILQIVRGEATYADYLQRHNINWIVDYVPVRWDINTASDFKGIPMANLEAVFTLPFLDYSFVESTMYVFRVK